MRKILMKMAIVMLGGGLRFVKSTAADLYMIAVRELAPLRRDLPIALEAVNDLVRNPNNMMAAVAHEVLKLAVLAQPADDQAVQRAIRRPVRNGMQHRQRAGMRNSCASRSRGA